MPIQTRHPVAMAQQALANQAVCAGRFTLGLGPSHHWIVEDMLGLSYDKPARQVRDYLDVMSVALGGPGPVDVDNPASPSTSFGSSVSALLWSSYNGQRKGQALADVLPSGI